MRKSTFVLLGMGLLAVPVANAEKYFTSGDGVEYSFEVLSETPGSFVTKIADGVFEVTDTVTVVPGDKFVLDKGALVKLGNYAKISLECPSVMDGGESRTVFTRLSDADTPCGLWMESPEMLCMQNVDFHYAGLVDHSAEGARITNCSFHYANGRLNSVGALNCGTSGATYEIRNCSFSECQLPGVGTAANAFTNLLIENCDFFDCNSDNTNKPQINITVGLENPVIVRGCTITGTGRTRVGGIAVSNVLAAQGLNKVLIENNTVTDNRYGITATGPLWVEIRNNMLLNNCHDPNPMTGGSGISLAGYNYGQSGIIEGNHIEGHLWGITLIQCEDINCGQVGNPDSKGGNVFKDNGNNGQAYDLYNNGKNKVYAQLNTWSVPEQTEELIETVISHYNDDPSLGEVIFMPAAEGSAVGAIVKAEAGVRYFNLQGVEVSNPTKGIYLVRKGTETTKSIIR